MIEDNNGVCNLQCEGLIKKKFFMNFKNNKVNGEDGIRNEYIKVIQINVVGL